MSTSLPPSEKVNILALSQIFHHTTNSYKLVFFQAILNLLHEKLSARGSILLNMEELAIEMAAVAWYPHTFFKLSFGSQDQMHRVLDRLKFTLDERAIAHPSAQRRLRQAIREQHTAIGLRDLLRYVPYRLLTPFFIDRLRGVPDAQVNHLVRGFAAESYASKTPALYRIIESDNPEIEINPKWVAYLTESLPIISGWFAHKWIDYLQSRNPNIPSISKKISPPLRRSSLTSQTAYWRAIIGHKAMHCIYSGAELEPNNFALDHFIPWSFVCHDQLWNLIPVSPSANSAKSNRLPSEKYLGAFISIHSSGLKTSRQILGKIEWSKKTEPFVSDLRITYSDLLNTRALQTAYLAVVPAMLSIAKQTGFSAEWQY